MAGARRKAHPVAARARPTAAATLYDEDFYAWTQEQAKALRAHFRGDHRIDAEHLAEEIEDLGRSDLHAVESYVEQIIAPLLKLDYSGYELSRGHWRGEVEAFRSSKERKMTPAIRRVVRQRLPRLYERAARSAAASLHQHEPDFRRRLPKTSPYHWETVASRDVFAEIGVNLSA
jgi:hypothetical protein